MNDPELEAITDGMRDELRCRYPKLEFAKHKLQARGHALRSRMFWVKITAHGVLVDLEKDEIDDFLRRLAQIGYDDPKMLEKVFEVIDKLLDQG